MSLHIFKNNRAWDDIVLCKTFQRENCTNNLQKFGKKEETNDMKTKIIFTQQYAQQYLYKRPNGLQLN